MNPTNIMKIIRLLLALFIITSIFDENMALGDQGNCNWLEKDVVEKSYGGSACRGVFLSRQEERISKKRHIIIEAIDSIRLLGSISKYDYKDQQFENKVSKQNFMSKVDNFGSRLAFEANFQYGAFFSAKVGLDVENENSKTKQQKRNENNIYNSAIKICNVPTKSVDLVSSNIRLNQRVLQALIKLENKLDENYVEKNTLIKNFFETFGSHVMTGLFEFGGRIIASSEVSVTNITDFNSIKETVKSSLSAYADASFGFGAISGGVSAQTSAFEFKEKFETDLEEKTLKKIKLSLKKIGGPLDQDDFQKWREGLTSDMNTWTILEKPKEFTAIWELIQLHHSQYFQDAHNLTEELKKEWILIERKDYEKEMATLPTKFNDLGISSDTAGKRKEILVDVLRERNVGAKYGNKIAHFSIIPGGSSLLMSVLQYKPVDPDMTYLKFQNVRYIPQEPYRVYLELEHQGSYLGHIIITLDGHRSYPRLVEQFIRMSTGDNTAGASYINAGFEDGIFYQGRDGEFIACAGARTSDGQKLTEVLFSVEDEGSYTTERRKAGQVKWWYYGPRTSFKIITRDSEASYKRPVIGHITQGLSVLRAATARGSTYVKQIKFSDSGLVVID